MIDGFKSVTVKYGKLAFRVVIKLSRHALRRLEIIAYADSETDVELMESLHRS